VRLKGSGGIGKTYEARWPGNQLSSKLYLLLPKSVCNAASGPSLSGCVWLGNVPVSQASYLNMR